MSICVTVNGHADSLSTDWVFAKGRTVVITENRRVFQYLLPSCKTVRSEDIAEKTFLCDSTVSPKNTYTVIPKVHF